MTAEFSPEDARHAVEALQAILEAIDRGEVSASEEQRAHIAGAADALARLPLHAD